MNANQLMKGTRSILCAGAVLAAAGAAATLARADDQHWIHIRVEDKGDKAETVRINLPVALLESLAPALRDSHIDMEKLDLGDKKVDKATLQSMWDSVRKGGDAEFVTVESEDETVRVSKTGDELVIKVRGSRGKQESVDARLPAAVVDALLSGPDETLNIPAAIEALKMRGAGELLAVDDASSTVRIWIDGKNSDR